MIQLKKIMFDLNIKQNKMANDLNINTTTLNNYVNNKTQPDIETLVKIADYFNVSIDYLCGRQYNNQVGYIPDAKKELVKMLIKLDEEDSSKLSGYMYALLENKKNRL